MSPSSSVIAHMGGPEGEGDGQGAQLAGSAFAAGENKSPPLEDDDGGVQVTSRRQTHDRDRHHNWSSLSRPPPCHPPYGVDKDDHICTSLPEEASDVSHVTGWPVPRGMKTDRWLRFRVWSRRGTLVIPALYPPFSPGMAALLSTLPVNPDSLTWLLLLLLSCVLWSHSSLPPYHGVLEPATCPFSTS